MQDEVISVLLTHCDCDKSLTTTITWCWEGFSGIKLNKALVLHLVADLNVKAFLFFANTAAGAVFVFAMCCFTCTTLGAGGGISPMERAHNYTFTVWKMNGFSPHKCL